MSTPPKQDNSLPSRYIVTATQVHTLLNVAGMLMPYILQPHQELQNIPSSHKIDGEAALAAQTTFINVCDRLDKIVADESRWSLDAQKTLEASAAEVYEHHKALLREQIIATRTLSSPHNRYRPTLYKLKDGTYAAILGDINDLENAITAVGDSPLAAMLAWDMIFEGKLDPKLFEWLQQREAALESGEPTPPMPKTPKRKKTK